MKPRAVRIPYHLVVTVYAASTFTRGIVQNLSAGGVYVWLDNPLPEGERVDFDLELPGGVVHVDAVVRWSRETGVGLEFVDADAHTAELLADCIERVEGARMAG